MRTLVIAIQSEIDCWILERLFLSHNPNLAIEKFYRHEDALHALEQGSLDRAIMLADTRNAGLNGWELARYIETFNYPVLLYLVTPLLTDFEKLKKGSYKSVHEIIELPMSGLLIEQIADLCLRPVSKAAGFIQ